MKTLLKNLITFACICFLSSYLYATDQNTPVDSTKPSTSQPVPILKDIPVLGTLFEAKEPQQVAQVDIASETSNDNILTRVFKMDEDILDSVYKKIGQLVESDNIFINKRTNSLIVLANKEKMNQITHLIGQWAKEEKESKNQIHPQNIAFRVYAVEVPSKIETMKPFNLMLRIERPDSRFSDLVIENVSGIIIESIETTTQKIRDEGRDEDKEVFFVQHSNLSGKTTSSELIWKIVGVLQADPHQSVSVERLDINVNKKNKLYSTDIYKSNAVEAPLPVSIRKTIEGLIGHQVHTVGFWFGHTSFPGQCMVPLGTWRLTIQTEQSKEKDMLISIDLSEKSGDKILTNLIHAKLNKPIIVGYTREERNVLRQGALIIIPQLNLSQPQPGVQSNVQDPGFGETKPSN